MVTLSDTDYVIRNASPELFREKLTEPTNIILCIDTLIHWGASAYATGRCHAQSLETVATRVILPGDLAPSGALKPLLVTLYFFV